GTFYMNPNKICPAHNACARDVTGGWALYERYVRTALDNRVTITDPGLLAPTAGNLTNFRMYAEPELNGTAPTRLVGARLTDVVLNQYEKDAMGAWKSEGAAAGFVSRIWCWASLPASGRFRARPWAVFALGKGGRQEPH